MFGFGSAQSLLVTHAYVAGSCFMPPSFTIGYLPRTEVGAQ